MRYLITALLGVALAAGSVASIVSVSDANSRPSTKVQDYGSR